MALHAEEHDPSEQAYEIRVLPDGDTAYALELWQAPIGNSHAGAERMARLARIEREPLKAIVDQILSALKRSGYRGTDLRRGRREPFRLLELEAIRLGVLFVAVRLLRKVNRMRSIAEQIARMEPEELTYWFAKIMATQGGDRARRALRMLMAEE